MPAVVVGDARSAIPMPLLRALRERGARAAQQRTRCRHYYCHYFDIFR